MEGENEIIYSIIEQKNIKIENLFGIECNLEIRKINQYCYKNKYSMLVLNNENLLINNENEKKNDLLVIDVNKV